jgi:hypothetical protein
VDNRLCTAENGHAIEPGTMPIEAPLSWLASTRRCSRRCAARRRGQMHLIVLPGDGIGPEITKATITVLDTASRKHALDLKFDYDDVGFASLEKYGTTLRDETLEKAKTYDGIILGPQSHMDYPPRD